MNREIDVSAGELIKPFSHLFNKFGFVHR